MYKGKSAYYSYHDHNVLYYIFWYVYLSGLFYDFCCLVSVGLGGGGGRVLPYMGYKKVCAAVKGMVFKQFTLG